MTLRLYRADAFLAQFDARVIERRTHNGRPAVLLDQTAFYPSAGGQPNDLGALGSARVLDVIEQENAILHVLDRELSIDAVHGELEWPRRFDHMQQHSGQHLLSQAFVRMANLDTIAVHIGAQECTLDLPAPKVTAAMLDAAEDAANAIVYEDRPFLVYEVSAAQLASIPLRKMPKVTGQVRIVEIEGYDWSACGGTHVRNAGQIGAVKIIKVEKRGNEARITFICGRRALLDHRRTLRDALALADGFTVVRSELPDAVARLREEVKTTGKALAAAQMQLAEYEARDLLDNAAPGVAGVRIIAAAWDGRDASALRGIARRLTTEPGIVALLGGGGARAMLCFARSRDLTFDMAQLLRDTLQTLGAAKGGGSPDFAQGGGVPVDHATLQAELDRRAAGLSAKLQTPS
jgi:alanyl-tRNA synthetase